MVLTFRAPQELADRLDALAASRGLERSELLRQLVVEARSHKSIDGCLALALAADSTTAPPEHRGMGRLWRFPHGEYAHHRRYARPV
jgi:predicted DNA-binding protein